MDEDDESRYFIESKTPSGQDICPNLVNFELMIMSRSISQVTAVVSTVTVIAIVSPLP